MRRLVDNGLKDAIVSDEVLSSHWWLIELWPGHCVMYVGTEESFHVWWNEKIAEVKTKLAEVKSHDLYWGAAPN